MLDFNAMQCINKSFLGTAIFQKIRMLPHYEQAMTFISSGNFNSVIKSLKTASK